MGRKQVYWVHAQICAGFCHTNTDKPWRMLLEETQACGLAPIPASWELTNLYGDILLVPQ